MTKHFRVLFILFIISLHYLHLNTDCEWHSLHYFRVFSRIFYIKSLQVLQRDKFL